MNLLGKAYVAGRGHLRTAGSLVRPERNQQLRMTRQFLGEWQAHRDLDSDSLLARTLDHARQNVPFYKDYFASNPQKNPANLTDWPLLTRDILCNELQRLQTVEPTPWQTWTHASGGSSGQPAVVVHDDYFAAKAEALRQLCGKIFYGGPHYNSLILWGMHKEVESKLGVNQPHSLKKRILAKLGIQTSHINTFEFTQEKFAQCVEILQKQRPSMIFGYAGSVYELAKYLHENSIPVPHPPKIISTTAQTLYPFMQELIEEVFHCPVCNHYGSREVGPLAWQYASGAMYFPKFFAKLEVIDNDGNPVQPGEQGRILITTLHNQTMPLVRYEIGDVGILGDDTTLKGYEFATLLSIAGRTNEEFINIRGSRICGPFFINLFYYRPWLDRFYIHQKAVDLIEILYTLKQDDQDVPTNELHEITEKIHSVMTEHCKIVWKKVAEMPTTPAGKRLFIRSDVKG